MIKTTLKERLLKKLHKRFEEIDADCDRECDSSARRIDDELYDLARGRLQNMLDVIKMVKKSRD
jgi:hypothetical protein